MSSDGIRALRYGRDDGTKAELAWKMWKSQDLALPRKREILLDFVLDRLLKGREDQGPFAPLPQELYWSLLDQLTESSSETLPSVLLRHPVLPILSSVFDRCWELSPTIFNHVLAVFARLLPLAAPRTTVDTLLQCTQSMYKELESSGGTTGPLDRLMYLYIRETEGSIQAGGANPRKKAHIHLLEHGLKPIMAFLGRNMEKSPLRTALVSSLQSNLFALDTLRREMPPEGLLTTLRSALEAEPSTVLALADILRVYISSLRKHASALFPYSKTARDDGSISRSAIELHQLTEIRNAVFDLLDGILALPETRSHPAALQSLISAVQDEAMYVTGGGARRLEILREATIIALDCKSIESLTALIMIDFQIIAPQLPRVLSFLASIKSSQASTTLLGCILNSYAKTRQLPTYLDLLVEALVSVDASVAFSSALVANTLLQQELKFSLAPTQGLLIIEIVSTRLRTAIEAFERRRQKRRKLEASAVQRYSAIAYVACLAIDSINLSKTEQLAATEIFEGVVESHGVRYPLRKVMAQHSTDVETQTACLAAMQVCRTIYNSHVLSGVPPLLEDTQMTVNPELWLEMIRLVFSLSNAFNAQQASCVWKAIIQLLSRDEATPWNGNIYCIAADQLPTALWALMSHSIGQLEHGAPDTVLEVFVRLLLFSVEAPTSCSMDHISTRQIKEDIFNSVELYEQPRIRAALLRCIASSDLPAWSRFSIIPLQVFPVAQRRAIAQKAMVANRHAHSDQDKMAACGFLLRAMESDTGCVIQFNICDHLADVVAMARCNEDAALLIFSLLFRSRVQMWRSTPAVAKQLNGVLRNLSSTSNLTGVESVLLRKALEIYRASDISSVNDKATAQLRALVEDLVRIFLPEIEKVDTNAEENTEVDTARVCMGQALLAACHWIDANEMTRMSLIAWSNDLIGNVAQHLSAGISSYRPTTHKIIAVLDLVSVRLHYTDDVVAYEAFLAMCLHLVNVLPTLADVTALRPVLSETFKVAPVGAYSAALMALQRHFFAKSDVGGKRGAIIDVARFLIEASPEDSIAVAAEALSHWLRILYEESRQLQSSVIVQPSLELLTSACSTKASFLDRAGAASMLATFSNILQSQPDVRGSVAQALSQLVVRRTEVVKSLLPSFCRVVSLLLSLSSVGQVEAADDLWTGRLLSTLGSMRALAGGLRKHTLFILLPWLRAGAPGRTAFGPKTGGLAALIGALGTFERESLLRGYLGKDEDAERVLFKAMVREYERSRYKGEA